MVFDVIIPVLNEEQILIKRQDYYQALKKRARIIFVDGGSIDRTVDLAAQFGDVIKCRSGKAIQKNRGVSESMADYLLFLNVDSYIRDLSFNQAYQAIQQGLDAGCFTMQIDDRRRIFRVFEFIINFRAKVFGSLDGDSGLLVKRTTFEQVRGFDEIPLMEDIAIGCKLRKMCTIKCLPSEISVSSRKWHDQGFYSTLLFYTRAYMQFWTQVLLLGEKNFEYK